MRLETEKKLILAAVDGMENAFTGTNKPQDMRFGAAVFTKKGNIYSSGQYYSDTYSLTLHAEQVQAMNLLEAETILSIHAICANSFYGKVTCAQSEIQK